MDRLSILQRLETELENLTSQRDRVPKGGETSGQLKVLGRQVSEMRSAAMWCRRWTHGRQKYIWTIGVLAWGLPMYFAMNFVVTQKPLEFLPVSALLWAIGGYAFGWFTWSAAEKRYRRVIASLGLVEDHASLMP